MVDRVMSQSFCFFLPAHGWQLLIPSSILWGLSTRLNSSGLSRALRGYDGTLDVAKKILVHVRYGVNMAHNQWLRRERGCETEV